MVKTESIENHGIVGDLNTVALVALDGTVDFFCFPRFDSPTVFASLLDSERGGRFSIQPEIGQVRRKQLYLPDSNVLLTRLVSDEGVAEISDFMPVEEAINAHNLVRRVKSLRGDISCRSALTMHRGTAHPSPIARPVLVLRVDAPGAGHAALHDMMVTRDYFDALPESVRQHLVCRVVDELVPVTQKHDIEGLVMGTT